MHGSSGAHLLPARRCGGDPARERVLRLLHGGGGRGRRQPCGLCGPFGGSGRIAHIGLRLCGQLGALIREALRREMDLLGAGVRLARSLLMNRGIPVLALGVAQRVGKPLGQRPGRRIVAIRVLVAAAQRARLLGRKLGPFALQREVALERHHALNGLIHGLVGVHERALRDVFGRLCQLDLALRLFKRPRLLLAPLGGLIARLSGGAGGLQQRLFAAHSLKRTLQLGQFGLRAARQRLFVGRLGQLQQLR